MDAEKSGKMDGPHAWESTSKKGGKKVKKKQKQDMEELDEKSKKPSMKTASDVISRILWDESLPKRKFVVGYLDRFEGIMEKPFMTLDWSDPATVDNNTLALPKHRIQYFKYRNKKVWDKNSRTDIVFGSTGFGMSINEFMKLVDSNRAGFMDEYFIDEKKGDKESEDSSSDEDEERPPRPLSEVAERPNFFVAARIVNPETVANLNRVADYIRGKDPLLGECCAAQAVYHVTLAILKLDTTSAIADAIEALEALKTTLLSPVTIDLETLDVFRHRVLYACVPDDEKLRTLRDHLLKELSDRNLNMLDRFSFVPHVTVAKISRPVARVRHSKYIDQYLYLQFEDEHFGSQTIDTLHLCEMIDERREDGFYMCAAEVNFC